MFGGCIKNSVEGNVYATADQVITDIVNDFFNAQSPTHARLIISSNVSVPTGDFLAVGGFDESFNVAAEDREISQRWRSQGRELIYWPDAVAYHQHRTSFGQFLRQHFRYGRGAAHFKRTCEERNASAEYRDCLFHRTLGRRVWRALAGLSYKQRAPVALLLGVWQLAYAAGFAYELIKPRAPS
jgi:N-acetylglucosaminyl-diphospho-decaprenol L-rhamnosyltransferase